MHNSFYFFVIFLLKEKILQHGGDYHKGRAESRDLGFLVPPGVLPSYLNLDGQLTSEIQTLKG